MPFYYLNRRERNKTNMDMNIIKRDIGLMCAAQKLLNFFCIMKTVLTVATIAFSVLESVNMLKNLKTRA